MMRRWKLAAAATGPLAFSAGSVSGAMAQKDVPIPEGSKVCVDCHEAKKGDKDAFDHYGILVATIVTPVDCAQCHEKESKQASGGSTRTGRRGHAPQDAGCSGILIATDLRGPRSPDSSFQ